jgi:enamine deaminase RidA (YjgF/YER057c/UK114 family)
MENRIEQRLKSLGIDLPSPSTPGGNYVPAVIVHDMVYLAGQVTRRDGKVQFVGKLGRDFDVAQGQDAARLCAQNLLAQLKAACGGDLDRVIRCVRLAGFVNCTPDFSEQPQVINGASDLMVALFGEAGKHVRTAVGVNALPSGVACEVEAIFQIHPS